ncbi:hypothetical protein F4X33_15455 [Candidatus Poribacteria bacterium]|nr:hypothetical protein [Candidatus Poribacteria bacterium]
MLIIYLTIAVLSVFIGAVIAFYTLRSDPIIFAILTGFTASTVVGFIGFFFIPHLYGDLGWVSLVVMAGGFLPIFLIERISHHNPQFPIQNHRWVADVTVIGLTIHALTDGFNLAIASRSELLGPGLAVVVLVHRLPVAFVLTLAFLSDNSLIATIGRRLSLGSRLQFSLRLAFIATVGRLLPLSVAPVVGAFIGERILTGGFGEFTEYLTAFAAGTLLNVVIENFHGGHAPHTHAPDSEEQHSHEVLSMKARILSREKITGVVAFVVGLFAVLLLTRDVTHDHHGLHQPDAHHQDNHQHTDHDH